MRNKTVVGITGGSGCGKTTVAEKIRDAGFPVIDADVVARQVVEPGKKCLEELKAVFGEKYIQSDGTLNRRKLGGLVFSDKEKLRYLNEITGKYIREEIERRIFGCNSSVIFIDGAVLIESGMRFDFMIAVLADINIRINRIMERDGLDEKSAKERINSQKKDKFYIDHSDFVIYNNGSRGDINVEDILLKIKNGRR